MIQGDGKTLATYDIMDKDAANTFTVDVTGVTQITFQITIDAIFSAREFGVANVTLSTSGEAIAQFNEPIGSYINGAVLGKEIKAYQMLDGAREFTRTAPGKIMGAEYEYGLMNGGSNQTSSISYNLNGKYVSMSGIYGPMDDTRGGSSATLKILGDGKTLATYDIMDKDATNTFTVDVTGVTQITFQITIDAIFSAREFGVANVTLSTSGEAIA